MITSFATGFGNMQCSTERGPIVRPALRYRKYKIRIPNHPTCIIMTQNQAKKVVSFDVWVIIRFVMWK
jgi:hypothetical protein